MICSLTSKNSLPILPAGESNAFAQLLATVLTNVIPAKAGIQILQMRYKNTGPRLSPG
jgi:hypothetical protein